MDDIVADLVSTNIYVQHYHISCYIYRYPDVSWTYYIYMLGWHDVQRISTTWKHHGTSVPIDGAAPTGSCHGGRLYRGLFPTIRHHIIAIAREYLVGVIVTINIVPNIFFLIVNTGSGWFSFAYKLSNFQEISRFLFAIFDGFCFYLFFY